MMRLLDPEEQKQFRAEYQQLENEIQKNIAVYFSALVVAAGWIFGPQSKPIMQIFLGNEGTNIFGLLILLAVNVIFTCFLTYKSIRIQEIMQFVAYLSPAESAIQYWESWRRSSQSLTKKAFARQHHMAAIILVPFWVSILLLWGTHRLIWTNPNDLARELQQFQHDDITHLNPSASGLPSSPIAAPFTSSSQELLIERIDHRLHIAKRWWWVAFVFHYIPISFFAVSWLVANRKWREIQKLKPLTPDFKELVQIPEPESSNIRPEFE